MRPTLEITPLVNGAGLKLIGEVDLAAAGELTNALFDISTESEIHLELSEVTFMDSSGLNAIVTYARLRNGAGSLVMLNPPAHIERLFAITGLDQHPRIEIRHTASVRPHLAGAV